MTEAKKGWPLLHSELPDRALKPISSSVYGVDGLTDVNEGYIITRLFASELGWSWTILRQEYLGHEDREVRGKGYTMRYYLAAVHGRLDIGGQSFDGSGAHDNRKIDAAFKGAATVAFKNAAKTAGLFAQLLLDGRAMDFIYATADVPELPNGTAQANANAQAVKEAEQPADPPTTPSDGQPSTGSASGAPQIQLSKRQIDSIKFMLTDLSPDLKAKERAWAKMMAQKVASNDDFKTFLAGADELIEVHVIACGPGCKHVEVLKASGVLDQTQAA